MDVRTAVKVKTIRRQMGWTRKDVARMLGVSIAFISRVERAEQEMSKDMLKRFLVAVWAKYTAQT
jgi:transcriptional regulator with XRE-family HTH domain